jgi:acyl dehydratase/CBS domain-containing protein
MLVPISVREVMVDAVETVGPEATAREAASRLFEAGIGSLVVVDEGDPVGIVTDADLTQLVAEGGDPSTTSVNSFMASPLVSTTADATIESAAATMRESTIKRLPVLGDGEVVGIVTTTDLSNYLPHLIQLGRESKRGADAPPRRDARDDTAYERDAWTFAYRGDDDAVAVGDTVTFTKELTTDDVEAFAEASGDTNRLHLDEEFAAGTRFGGRIAHGTLVVGVISAALARLPGTIVYLSQDVSYLGPVPIGTEVTATCEVVEDIGQGRFRLSTAVDTAETTVVDGEAVVISDELPEDA